MFYSSPSASLPEVIRRDIMLPKPVLTRLLKIIVIESAEDVDIKVDLLGREASDIPGIEEPFSPQMKTRRKIHLLSETCEVKTQSHFDQL